MTLKEQQGMAELHWKLDLLGSIEVGIVVLDADFRVLVWNEFMHHHSGIIPSNIQGQSLFDWFSEIDEQWFKHKANPVFKLNSPAYIIWEQRAYLFKFPPKRPITAPCEHMFQNITIFPLTSVTGQVDRICVMVYDVTDEAISKQRSSALTQQLKTMSRIDGLTNLFNRRYWEEQCHAEFLRSERTGRRSSLILLDIDHFKKVNDTYGHPAGDAVIKTLARTISEQVRETDKAGRYGGEEFAIILPETSSSSAQVLAERLRRAVEATTVEHEDLKIQVTISLGIAESHSSYDSHTAWIEAADKGLYKAKESGRNQSIIIR